jgi:hypothetical protein
VPLKFLFSLRHLLVLVKFLLPEPVLLPVVKTLEHLMLLLLSQISGFSLAEFLGKRTHIVGAKLPVVSQVEFLEVDWLTGHFVGKEEGLEAALLQFILNLGILLLLDFIIYLLAPARNSFVKNWLLPRLLCPVIIGGLEVRLEGAGLNFFERPDLLLNLLLVLGFLFDILLPLNIFAVKVICLSTVCHSLKSQRNSRLDIFVERASVRNLMRRLCLLTRLLIALEALHAHFVVVLDFLITALMAQASG